jgi:hypothetical protein
MWQSLMHAIEADDASAIQAMSAAGGEDFAALLCSHHPLDGVQRTPLMLAYWWGKPLASAALINAGSNYQQTDADGHGAAWYARRFGKGQAESELGSLIGAGERRISMEGVIEKGAPSCLAPPKRRKPSI